MRYPFLILLSLFFVGLLFPACHKDMVQTPNPLDSTEVIDTFLFKSSENTFLFATNTLGVISGILLVLSFREARVLLI
jgi:hypothetical protein